MKKTLMILTAVIAQILTAACAGKPEEKPAETNTAQVPPYTDVAILSTTDMHGKCWEENLMTGAAVTKNMLRVSTAVSAVR